MLGGLSLLLLALGHDLDKSRGGDGLETDPCFFPPRHYAPATYPWVKEVFVVSMTHLDIGGECPPRPPNDPKKQEKKVRYTTEWVAKLWLAADAHVPH